MQHASTTLVNWLTIWPIVIPLLTAALAIMLRSRVGWQPIIALAGFAATGVMTIVLLVHVAAKGPLALTMSNWLPPFGITFAVDMLGALLACVATLVAGLVAVYGLVDTDVQAQRYGFYPLMLMLLVGINGSFLTGDIFNLYVWFEVMLISSFGLIVIGGTKEQLDGAIKYCFISLIGTTFFLIATGLLYGVAGTLNMADLYSTIRALPAHAPLSGIALLYALAFCIKAAAFPVFFWLPASYHTPKFAVSAVFAGLLTKVGVYALIRTFTIVFAQGPGQVFEVLTVVGVATMLVGAMGAMAQNELRRMFGYLVISGVGSMIVGLALHTPQTIAAAIFYAVHSILVITALYLMAGAIFRMAGTTRLRDLGGLYSASPMLAGLFLVLVFAISGFPPFSGFWPKLILVSGGLAAEAYWPSAAVLVTGVLTTIAVGRAWGLVFWRPAPEGRQIQSLDRAQWRGLVWPVVALVGAIVIIGFFPAILFDLVATASLSLADPSAYIGAVLGKGS
ncbi:MAG: Na+/H+ antiporter subunit D [Alphaproteobacteria bacterium]